MKVNGNGNIQKMMALYQRIRENPVEAGTAKSDNKNEQVEISKTSRILYQKMQELKSEEDISVRAREIKELYRNNQYSVSTEELADRMISIMQQERDED